MWVLVSTMIFTSTLTPEDNIPLNFVGVFKNQSECEKQLDIQINSTIHNPKSKELKFDVNNRRVLIIKENKTITYFRCKEDIGY